MDWPLFHHPDFCGTVVRRRAAVEVLLLIEGLAALVLSRGRSLIWQWQDPLILVDRAWNMDRLDEAQAWYIDQAAVAVERVASGTLSRLEVLNLANTSVSAYLSVMEKDPLLPSDLLPAHYRSPDTLAALRSLQQTLAESL